MKFIRRDTVPAPIADRGGYRSRGRPDWLKEWIANLGQWCRLDCGHSADLNDRALLIIGVFGFDRTKECLAKSRSDVFCETCNEFTSVRCTITLMEHLGFEKAATTLTEVPLF